MIFIETPVFTRLVKSLISDEEYQKLQEALMVKPDLGVLIKHSGGLRKLRWRLEGKGKSGGVRVIYYWAVDDEHFRMLYMFPKGKQETLTSSQLMVLRQTLERWSNG